MADLEYDPTGFEDEPLGETGDSSAFQFEGVDTALAKAERRRERRRRRNERTGKIAVAVFCVCLIIALILIFKVFKVTEHYVHDAFVLETESPTMEPTHAPTIYKEPAPSPVAKPTFSVNTPSPTEKKTDPPTVAPTMAPTITPFPTVPLDQIYEVRPIEDTHVFIDGPEVARGYGREEKLFVQHGTHLSTKPGQEPDIPTAYAIIKYDLKTVSYFPDRSRWPEDIKIRLSLYHELQLEEAANGRGPSKLEVYRLPNNYDLEVESWTGSSFNSSPKEARDGVLVGQFDVFADLSSFYVDITKAFFLSDDRMSSGHYNDDQVMLMLAINEGTPRPGDEFHSRESDEPPTIQFVMRDAFAVPPP